MKKSDLKTGMILEFSNGDRAMVLLGTENGDIFSGTTWGEFSSFDDNLECIDSLKGGKIEKVYQPEGNMRYLFNGSFSILECKLLWERPSKVNTLCKKLYKKESVSEDMFAELSPKEMKELAELLISKGGINNETTN